MIYYFFAMEREAKMLKVKNKYVIGICATNMPKTTNEDIIINIGYCGGYKIPVGTIVEPIHCIDAETGLIEHIDWIFNGVTCKCFTSNSFVTEPLSKSKAVYDMELYKITQIPHKKIHSLKIVSDNLNETDCENFNDKQSWKEVNKYIKIIKSKYKDEK